jgi:hypothetical protein
VTTIQARPKTYRGVRFRSTLEACWALNLDTLNISWSYEPMVLIFDDGRSYLPDFYLPDISTWLEVKGPNVPGLWKTRQLANALPDRPDSPWWDPETAVVIGRVPTADRMAFEVVGASEGALASCRECDVRFWMDYAGSFECRGCHTAPGGGSDNHLCRTYKTGELPWVRLP